jgi:hypothetical protein
MATYSSRYNEAACCRRCQSISGHLFGTRRTGPIRERYLGAEPGHFTRFDRTEICWPIFGAGHLSNGEDRRADS